MRFLFLRSGCLPFFGGFLHLGASCYSIMIRCYWLSSYFIAGIYWLSHPGFYFSFLVTMGFSSPRCIRCLFFCLDAKLIGHFFRIAISMFGKRWWDGSLYFVRFILVIQVSLSLRWHPLRCYGISFLRCIGKELLGATEVLIFFIFGLGEVPSSANTCAWIQLSFASWGYWFAGSCCCIGVDKVMKNYTFKWFLLMLLLLHKWVGGWFIGSLVPKGFVYYFSGFGGAS